MPRIFVITSVHGRYDVRVFLKQCRSLASSGHKVSLVVQDGKGYENREGVEILDLGKPPVSRLRRILYSPWRMYRFLRKSNAEVIHLHDPELLPVGFLLKKNNKRVIYDSHEDYPRQILSKHWIAPPLRRTISFIFEQFENFVVKKLDAVVCATPFISKRFQDINPKSIDVNNFPFLKEFLPLYYQQEKFSRQICYIGAMTRERGITELIEALDILQDVTLIMCGPFESESYANQLKAMPGWKFVNYRGIVGRDVVAEIMSSSAVGVVTYLPSPNHIDSQPNKMFEYMSAGIPLIASHFPLWKNIVEKNNCGLCVNPSSPSEIADAIETMLSDQTLCLKMGRSGRNAVDTCYNWENEYSKLLDLYSGIIKEM